MGFCSGILLLSSTDHGPRLKLGHPALACSTEWVCLNCTGLTEQNVQTVVSVTNKLSLQQTWFNAARRNKPQTFQAATPQGHDSTSGGKTCDFCAWETSTANDLFGRSVAMLVCHSLTTPHEARHCKGPIRYVAVACFLLLLFENVGIILIGRTLLLR